ncbi:hypothetical protein KUF54_13155 [Comamonas sp. Y33R10-2]|uniref:hypothetical protein n=1 Tax=Comamonas sp. Y33R10-2 TaxID=2853257 RepID=UPI001C5C8B3F|nr:hypothetical protein [Comamonas sp. Y33R10-2]QXZ08983.1 hypothetical protein KUF54_13155 [Comamonas sp. Y33R10-2]
MNLKTLLFIAASACATCTWAQIDLKSATICPQDWQMSDKQLQGEWLASIAGSNDTIRIVLGPHPEWRGNVKGSISRPASTHPMVGDVNQNSVTLEESADGSRITGTWLGEVQTGSCGTEIHGDYLAGEDAPPQTFILRKAKP